MQMESFRHLEDAKFFDGKKVKKLPVGICKNRIHPGYVSTALMKEHKCIAKKCPYFDRNELHPIWDAREYHRLHKKIGKLLRKYYLQGIFNHQTYVKLVNMHNKCEGRYGLISFCDYLMDVRRLDIPLELYNEIVPDWMNDLG